MHVCVVIHYSEDSIVANFGVFKGSILANGTDHLGGRCSQTIVPFYYFNLYLQQKTYFQKKKLNIISASFRFCGQTFC